MKILSAFFAVTLLVSAVFGQPATLSYNVGDEWQFDYNTDVDTRGYVVTTQTRTQGAFTTINGTLLIQCQDQDAHSNLFAFNLFDNSFNVGEGIAQNYTDYEDGALGETMYYQQNFTGQITQVWYESDDDPVLVNIRLGLINAFHTHLTGYGNQFQAQESDPVAIHNTNIQGVQSTQPGVNLEVHKKFTQNDVITFSDPSVNKWNVAFLGATNTWVDSNGHIVGATLEHNVNLVDINQSNNRKKTTKSSKAPQDGSNVPMDSYLSSLGVMTINGAAPVNNQESEQNGRKLDKMTFSSLKQSAQHTGANMFDMAAQLIANKKANFTTENNMIRAVAAVVFGSEEIAYGKQIKLIRHLNNAAQKDVSILKNVLKPILMRFQGMIGQKGKEHYSQVHSRLMNLLASISHPFAHDLLVQQLTDSDSQLRLNTIYSLAHVRVPSQGLVEAVFKVAEHDCKKIVRTAALLHTGILIRKLHEAKQGAFVVFAEKLLQFVEKKVEQVDMDVISTAVKALGNAGASAFAPKRFGQVMTSIFRLGNDALKQELMRFVAKKPVDIETKALIQGSPMPFNESYTASVDIGGSILGLTIDGELFAGTNFDCNEPVFNYEALADAKGVLSFFGYTHSVFEAEAVYGKVNGAPLADELLLTVWGDVIYQQPIPEVDCAEHYYPIAHEAPGIDVSYTLWIVIVPISFTAQASVTLNLQWGWKICDTDLSILVELIPTATPNVYGDAEIDLYIIKAGIELTGAFQMSVVPQAYIDGSECTVGFDIRQENPPMSVALTSYYEWQECFLFFFDCHWAQKNQYVWYSWSYPAQNIVLYQEQWKIAGEKMNVPVIAAN